jgi:glycine cleavage system H protein
MRFTKSHEWVDVQDDGTATVGITRYAADQLGDVVFVETPEVGTTVGKGESFAVVESVKAASDVYSPVSGEVVEANADLATQPEMVNADAQKGAWFARLRLSAADAELGELMTAADYDTYIASL